MKIFLKKIFDKIVAFFKNVIDKIVEFFKSQTRETNIKIAAVSAAVLLIVVVLLLATGRDNALFPDREWQGFFPSNKEETTTTPAEETTPAETTKEGEFDDSNIGEWLPVN